MEEFRQRNQHVQAEVSQAKEKAAWTIEQEALRRIQANPALGSSELAIARVIVQVAFDKNKYVPNKWLARAMIQNIQYKLCNDVLEDQEAIVARIAQSFFE